MALRPKLSQPGFWQQPPGLLARVLSPVAELYGSLVARRMSAPGRRLEIPVICVGNFTLGGAGKTPLAIAVARMLAEAGERPTFLTRGYGGTTRGPLLVDAAHGAALVGDEPVLLARVAPTVVSADRIAGAKLAVASGATVIVMDDGFQNPDLAKDGAVIAVDGGYGIGNGLSFPAGPLRAPLHAQTPLASAVVVIGSGEPGERVAAYCRGAARPVFSARLEPIDPRALAGRRVLGFAGIGRPEKFRRTLLDLGADVAGFQAFADHHRYTEADAAALATRAQAEKLLPVTTEKDLVRLTGGPARIALASMAASVPVRLVFENDAGFRKVLLGLMRR